MNRLISVIIPNYNGSSTVGKCLDAAFSSKYENFEVIVVDDCSTDNSVEIIKNFPCRLIALDKNSGASKARNAGAKEGSGEIFFFIDSDCVMQKDTLAAVNKAHPSPTPLPQGEGTMGRVITGGTYTKIPYDDSFFSAFQSIFINYSETKKKEPDYIATHAMVVDQELFRKFGGFSEDFLPIIEDVEFSHRLRRSGVKLIMNPDILVRHIFNFTLKKSLRNAFRKAMYWTIYSMANRDLFKDSGTASLELKVNVVSCFISILLLCLFFLADNYFALIFAIIIQILNIGIINRKLIKEFLDAKGLLFAFASAFYYAVVYPFAVGAGAVAGITARILKLGVSRT